MGVSITMAKTVPLDMLPAGLLPNTEEEEKKRKSNAVPADMLPDSLRAVPTDMLPNSLRPPAPAPTPAAAPVITSGPNPFATPEDKGFFSRNIDWAADNLRSGWENLISGMEGLKQSEAAEYATRLEEKYGPGAVNAPPDKQQTYKEAVQIVEQAKAERQRISAQQQQRQEINPQREATRELKAAITGFDKDELSFLDSAAKAGGALLSNPVGVIADLGMESLPASLAMMSSALLVRFGGGTALASAGVGGTTSAVTEFGNEYAARIEKGIPHDKAWSDAAQKSGVIGLLDAVSMNSAGRAAGVVMDALTGTRKRLGKAATEVVKETGTQAALGAAGEAGGSLFIGEMPNPAAVIAEAAGEVFGAPMEAIGTYRSLKPTEKPREYADTPEGRAMRGLDAIANEEEKARNAEFAAATADGRGIPVARTLENLTEQEVNAIQRRLFAELGRPAEESELLEAFNEYVAEQNASLGIESGASVAGISDTGAEQSTGTAGISDTGTTATPDTGGLGTSGVSTDQLADRTTTQLGALDTMGEIDLRNQFRQMYDQYQELENQSGELENELSQLGVNTFNLEDDLQIAREKQQQAAALQNLDPTAAAMIGERQLTDLLSQVRLTNYESRLLEGDASTAVDNYLTLKGQMAALDSQMDPVMRRLDELAATNITEEDVAAAQPKSEEVIKEEAPATGVAALEAEERARNDEFRRIEEEQKALLTKAGRKPAKNSPARKKYDELEKQRIEAYWNWAASEKKLMGAKTAQETGVNIDQVIEENVQEFIGAYPDSDYEVADYDAQVTKLKSALRNLGVTDNKILKSAADKFDEVLMSKGSDSGPALAAAPEGPRVDSIERFPLGPTSIKPKVVAEGQPLYRETNAGGVDDLLRNDPQFTYAPVFVTDNPDLALGQGDNVGALVEFRPNSVSGEISPKPIPGELTGKEYKADVIAPKAAQRVTFDNARVLNGLSGLAKRTLSQNFDKKVLPNGKIEFTRKGAAGPALSPDTVGEYTKQPGETIEEYQERLLTLPKSALAPDIIQLIRNNDLNGALKAVAAKFSGGTKIRSFYGDLANRLAALNLPTEIRIDDARNLVRRSIDSITSAQQVRLFAYLRTTQPEIFEKYFKEYYKDSALESVYAGLVQLNFDKSKKILGPVENEFDDVLKAYDAAMAAMPNAALGAFFPNFDVINLNNNGLNYQVFLHEVVHAATEILLRTPSSDRTAEQDRAIEELERLYNIAKDNIKVKEYGLTNLSEFIAEVFTNSNFQSLLKGIPYAPAKTNVFRRFIQSIINLVGLDNVAGRAMVEAEKLFSVERPRALTSAGPRFMAANKPKKPRSKGTITGGFRTVESLKERVLASRPEWKDSLDKIRDKIWDPTMAFGRGIKLGAVELRHLSDMAGTKFPLIGGSVRIIEKMISHRGKIMTEAAAIAKDWMALQKKNVAKSKLLGRVMLEATLSGVEVDPLNTKYYDATKVDQRVKDAWNALGPEFQGIYRRVRDFYQKQMQDAIQIMRDRANQLVDPEQRQKMLDNIDRDFGPDKLIYPYFPLKRFGPYWFQVGPAQRGSNYKEFYTFESMGERNTALRQRKKELLAGNSAQRNLAEKHIELGDSVSELLTQMSDASNILKTVNELIGSLPDKFSDLQLQSQETIEDTILDVQKELRDDINQLLYTLMPEQSMRKQMITRKQVQGASEDMLRVFASSATRIAYQQARAKYSPQYLANLNNARSFIKDMKGVTTPEQRRVYRDFLHEMERRYKPMLGMEDTNTSEKIAGVISDAVTTFMMSAPMSAFLQTIGFFQFTATQLGGRYGYVEATDRMYENFKTYSVSTVDRTLVPLKNGQMLSVHFPSAMESGKLTGLDKIAAQQLMDEEQVNVSQTYDMVSVGDRSSDLTLSKYQAFKRAVFMPLHQIERFNREIGLLTAFQLEYEKLTSGPIRDSNGIIVRDAQGNPETYQNDATTPDGVPYSTEAYDRALTHAKDLVAITLGETTRQMRPRYFMNALLALPLKFKRYMITALYSMWSNFDKGFIEPFKTAEIEQMRKVLEANQESPDVIEQKIKDMEEFRAELSKEGRKALAGAMFNTFLVGGTAALPFYTTIFPLIIGMFIPDDDDDEFFDFDNWYRNYMENEFGGFVSGLFVAGGMDPAQARKLGRGIGEAVVVGPATKLTGGSLSDRVSLDIKSMAFRDMRYTPSARDATLEALAMALGPAAGLGLTAAEVKDLWEQKQYGRAFERGLPAILGKPITATRYALEEAKTKRGDTLVEDVTTTEIAMQAIGLAPYRVTKAQKQAIQAVQKVQKIEHRRTNIMNDMWMSYSRGDAEGFEAAYRKGLEFSAKYPTYEITDKMISSSFKNREEQQFIANEIGARVQMKDLPIVLPMITKE